LTRAEVEKPRGEESLYWRWPEEGGEPGEGGERVIEGIQSQERRGYDPGERERGYGPRGRERIRPSGEREDTVPGERERRILSWGRERGGYCPGGEREEDTVLGESERRI